MLCAFLGGNLVSWQSKKQSIVTRSSVEPEFRTMTLALCELLWLCIVLEDLKIKIQGSIELVCDNQLTISIAHNLVQHDMTKHVEIDRHFIKKKLDVGLIHISYVSFENQVADVLLPKELVAKRFEGLICKLGMMDIHSLA